MTRPGVLQGLVGGLAFLVLLGGYELATGYRAPPAVKFGVAALVAVTAGAAARIVRSRLPENGSA